MGKFLAQPTCLKTSRKVSPYRLGVYSYTAFFLILRFG